MAKMTLMFLCISSAAEAAAANKFLMADTGAVHHDVQSNRVNAHDHFASFVQEHSREYKPGSEEYDTRLSLFSERLASVQQQNSRPDRTWTATINKYADWTKDELKVLRGYKRVPRRRYAQQEMSLLGTGVRISVNLTLPKDVSWANLSAFQVENVVDQGICGSCWAIAAAETLRAHAELNSHDRVFSTQQILSCTQNPNECGGEGGCDGATGELAMEYLLKAPLLLTEKDFRYVGQGPDLIACPSGMQSPLEKYSLDLGALSSSTSGTASSPRIMQSSAPASFVREAEASAAASIGLMSYRKLEENRLMPLMQALYEQGPVLLSVFASTKWSMYSSGVIDACGLKDVTIDHAVVLIGYGEDTTIDPANPLLFWHILNSWGADWGENGTIRLLRRVDEEQHCGMDNDPLAGTGCALGPNKAPDQVRVCGSCGILYDNVVPVFRLSSTGLLHKMRR